MKMSATMRAKMKVTNVGAVSGNCQVVDFAAVCKEGGYPEDGKDEDNSYARWSPQANLSITIANPELHGQFEVGDKFYLDFTPAD